MGASNFSDVATGKTAKEAFRNAVEEAQYDHGHAGYSGTIAEKGSFVTISMPGAKLPTLREAERYADSLIEAADRRIDDKWGPAGCIEVSFDEPSKGGLRRFLFFGWASS